jgi:hypothetical protein
MATRATIRRRAVGIAMSDGRSVGFASRDNATALTSTAGGTLTLTDTAGLPPAGAATTTAKGWWLYLPTMTAANQRRIIASYAGATQTITHEGPVYDATTITALGLGTTPYLVLRNDPDRWNAAINEACRQLISEVKYDEITITTSGQVRYNLASAPFTLTSIVRDSQVADIEYRDVNDASGEERWLPWADGRRTWRTYMDEDDVMLDFGVSELAPDTSVRLRVKWTTQFAALTDETTAIGVDEYWAALGTLVVMSDWYSDVNDPNDDWNVLGRRVRVQFEGRRRGILGEDAFRQVQRTAQQTGINGVGGRGGRGTGYQRAQRGSWR